MNSTPSTTSSQEQFPDVFAAECPSREVLRHVTGEWAGLVLGALGEGPLRFSGLRRTVSGVSEETLTQTLQALERDGLVHRETYPEMPSRVEYSLTGMGHMAADRVMSLFSWVEEWLPYIIAAQQGYDSRGSEVG